jgi:hypothetical protein
MAIVTAQVARESVEHLLSRRQKARTYDEKVIFSRELVDMHLHEETPETIDECIKLYTEDAVWEAPARGITYVGRDDIRKNYLRIFQGTTDFHFKFIDGYATPDRCFIDMIATFRMTGDAWTNPPDFMKIGNRYKCRLLHSFHIRDGLIEREIGYELFSPE